MLEKEAVARWWKGKQDEMDLSTSSLARLLNCSQPYAHKLVNEGASYKTALKFANKAGWDLPPLRDLINNTQVRGSSTHLTLTSITPSAGLGFDNQHEILSKIEVPRTWLEAEYPKVKDVSRLALCTISGDSMEGTLMNGDTLVVDPAVDCFDTEGIYVFTVNDQVFIKRIQRMVSGGILIISDNKEHYPPQELPADKLEDVRVLARVRGKFGYKALT